MGGYCHIRPRAAVLVATFAMALCALFALTGTTAGTASAAGGGDMWLNVSLAVEGRIQTNDPWTSGDLPTNEWAKPMYYIWLDDNEDPTDGPYGNGVGPRSADITLDTGRLTVRWLGKDHKAGTPDDVVYGSATETTPGRWDLAGGITAWLGRDGDVFNVSLPLRLIGEPRALDLGVMATAWTVEPVDNLDSDENGWPWMHIAPVRELGVHYATDRTGDTVTPMDPSGQALLDPFVPANFDLTGVKVVITDGPPRPPAAWVTATVEVAGEIQTVDPWTTGSREYNEWAKPMYYLWLDGNGNPADGPFGNGQGPRSAQASLDTGLLTLRWFGEDRTWGTADDVSYGPYGESSSGRWVAGNGLEAWTSADGSSLSIRMPLSLVGDPASLDVSFMASPWTSSAVDVLSASPDPQQAAQEQGRWVTIPDTSALDSAEASDARGDAALSWPDLEPAWSDNFDIVRIEVENEPGVQPPELPPPPPDLPIEITIQVDGEIQMYDPWTDSEPSYGPRYRALLYDEDNSPIGPQVGKPSDSFAAVIELDVDRLVLRWFGPDRAWDTADDVTYGPLASRLPSGGWSHALGLWGRVSNHDTLEMGFPLSLVGFPSRLKVFLESGLCIDYPHGSDMIWSDRLGPYQQSPFAINADNWIAIDDATRIGEYGQEDPVDDNRALGVGNIVPPPENFDILQVWVTIGYLGGQQFADVPAAYPYAAAISGMAQRGIVSGYVQPYGSRLFKPDNPVWRAQFAKMICGGLGLAVTEDMVAPFGDLGPDDENNLYPHEYVAAAAAHEITMGTTPGSFSPYRNISRAQVVTMIVRAVANLYPGELALPSAGYTGTLGDFSPDHAGNMRVAEHNSLLEGLQGFGPSWDPWADATRGETAQMLWNVFTLLS